MLNASFLLPRCSAASLFRFNYQKPFFRDFARAPNNNDLPSPTALRAHLRPSTHLEDREVQVSLNFLRALGAPTGSWCVLSRASKAYLVRLSLAADDVSTGSKLHTLLVSPSVALYFSPLKQSVVIDIFRPDMFRVPPALRQTAGAQRNPALPALPLAKQLRLVKIRSGNQGGSKFAYLVKEYFEDTPHPIQVGEVLSIRRPPKPAPRLQPYLYTRHCYDFYKVDQIIYEDFNRIRRSEPAEQQKRANNQQPNSVSDDIKITDYGVIKDVTSQLQDVYYLWPSYLVWPEAQPDFEVLFHGDPISDAVPLQPVSQDLLAPFETLLPLSLGMMYSEMAKNVHTFMQETSNTFSLLSCRIRFPLNDTASLQVILERLRCESGFALHTFDLFEFFSFSRVQGLLQSLGDLAPAIVHISSLEALFCLTKASSVEQSQKELKMKEFLQTELRKLEARLFKRRTKLCLLFSFEVDAKIPAFCKIAMPFAYTIKAPEDKERPRFLDYQIQRRASHDPKFQEMPDLNLDALSRSLTNRSATQIFVIINRALTQMANLDEWDSDRLLESVERIQKQHKVSSEATAKVPSVRWEDVGGLQDAKQDILDTIQLPLAHPELFASGVAPRSGLLFFGPPGTGKTLLAKAIATECSLNFISVKGPELLNMYIGESEKNIREVFERGRANRPCVLFFDELDSLAPARGRSSDSGQVMDRIVAQLLTEMSGIQKSKGLFVIGATNRPDLLDSALLQPGRFDKPIYLGMASSTEQRVKILKAQTRKFILEEDVNLAEVAKAVPRNFSGADFSALTSEAFMSSVKKKIATFETKIKEYEEKYNLKGISFEQYVDSVCQSESEKEEMTRVVLSKEDFATAVKLVEPSVKVAELKRYEELRQKFASGF